MSAARSLPELPSAWPTAAAANDPTEVCTLHAPWLGEAGPFADATVGTASVHVDVSASAEGWPRGASMPDDDARIVRRLVASSRSGDDYPGDLWNDILDYRALRMRELGGVHLGGPHMGRIAELEQRLRTDDRGRARQFERYTCRAKVAISVARAELPIGSRPRIDATLADLSAGGAKLEFARASGIDEGSEIEVWIEEAGGPEGVALPARVIWVRPGELGLMFAGAPRRARSL